MRNLGSFCDHTALQISDGIIGLVIADNCSDFGFLRKRKIVNIDIFTALEASGTDNERVDNIIAAFILLEFRSQLRRIEDVGLPLLGCLDYVIGSVVRAYSIYFRSARVKSVAALRIRAELYSDALCGVALNSYDEICRISDIELSTVICRTLGYNIGRVSQNNCFSD